MSKENKNKHIIFLGAGASASSGYPLANRLVLLMSDRKTFFNEVNRCQKECGDPVLDAADDNIPFNSNDFFTFDSLLLKLVWFAQQPHFNRDSPIIFPWEIIHESGRLLTREEFLQAVGNDWEHTNLYDLFVGLWERAKEEVSTGSKFSFVGLSMSSFLEPAFRYLFSDLQGRAQFVVVNPENKRFESQSNSLHPRSPRGKTFAMLKKFVGKDFRFIQSSPGVITTKQLEEFETMVGDDKPTITAYDSFADFIYWELDG